jgi:hypothetical protein
MRGTRNLSAWRQTVSVWGSTPCRRRDRDRAVEHARARDLDREVDVAGRVDDVDAVRTPAWGLGRRQKQLVAALVMVMPRSCSWII